MWEWESERKTKINKVVTTQFTTLTHIRYKIKAKLNQQMIQWKNYSQSKQCLKGKGKGKVSQNVTHKRHTHSQSLTQQTNWIIWHSPAVLFVMVLLVMLIQGNQDWESGFFFFSTFKVKQIHESDFHSLKEDDFSSKVSESTSWVWSNDWNNQLSVLEQVGINCWKDFSLWALNNLKGRKSTKWFHITT